MPAPPQESQPASKGYVQGRGRNKRFSIVGHDPAPSSHRAYLLSRARACQLFQPRHRRLVIEQRAPVLFVETEHVEKGREQRLEILAIGFISSYTGVESAGRL